MPIDPNNDPNETAANSQPAPYYDQGTSNPQPNDGQVSTVSPAVPADAGAGGDSQMVTNGPTPAPANGPTAPTQPVHPAVKRAGVLNEIATALAGGPRFRTTIDPNTGAATRTTVPLSGREIGLAIALEAISGSLAGLGAKGPNATGQAAAAGLQQGQAIAQQRQQAQQQEDQQAQQGYQNQKQSLAQKAQIFEANSRTILNTAEAESRGAETIQKLADQNKDLIQGYDDAGVLQQRNVTQQELLDGMQSGKYNATEVLGPVDGYRLLGNGQVEATHALITNPEAKVPLTTDQWNSYADAHVPGWPKLAPSTNLAENFKVSGLQLAQANEIKNALTLAQQRHDEVTKALSESDNPKVQALAAQVPTINSLLDNPKTGPGLASALQRYQKYVSHSDLSHGMDLYESLQAMAQPSKSDGKGGFEPNPDAPFAQQIAQAYGGMGVLRAYHDEVAPLEIKSPAQAADMLASNDPGSRAYKYAQRWQRNYAAQQGENAAARKGANGTGTGSPSTSTGTGTGTGLSLVDQIGQGKIVPDRIGYLLSRNPSLLEEVSQKYPDFDSSKAATYPKTFQDFTSGKTAQALNAGGTALQHLYELLKLNTPASHIYGTPAYNAYQNKVDTVADELAKFYGNSTVSGIESYKKTLNSTLPGNREAAIRTQAQSMGSKMDSYETTWRNAAPSPAYQAPMPGISDKAKAARAALDPSYKPQGANVPTPPQGAIGKVPGSDGRIYWTDGKNNLGVAQ